ncbi:motility protein MotB [Stutzerimonas frequens]|uniref:flagellar motor protein MotB n=1 Tax=Stutzerimonas frequens TaxID=2968969 RepID=UPI000D7E6220|nr:flagellar motor protein MotB [Stutzerimonas frequens]AWT08767.1 motility protein MotB [Stutzerimonas frequens]
MDNTQPIIVKRVKKSAAGHHGGAWKIAFADFATAMMAFFLVMWLMSSATPEQKKLISGYFQDPIGFTESASPHVIDLGGTPTPSPDRTLNPELEPAQSEAQIDSDQAESFAEQLERERLDLVLQELQNKVEENPELQKFKDQILFEITQDGLRIQIMDAENRPMFALGSAQLQPYFEDILLALVDTIAAVPNKISISGHTDAKPFSGRSDFGNWELSASRANAARRTLVYGGYPEEQIARVVGYASSALFDRKDPFNPVNRRIDILVLTKKAQRSIEGEQPGAQPDDEGGAAPAQSSPGATGPVEEPLQSEQLRERLNIFEDGVLKFSEPGAR